MKPSPRNSQGSLLDFVEVIKLAGIFLAAAWWWLDSHAGIWPALVLLSVWAAGNFTKSHFKFDLHSVNPLAAPLLAFWITAGVGLWATYANAGGFSGPAGWEKYYLISGSILIFFILAQRSSLRGIQFGTAAFGFFSTGVAVYFLMTVDFAGQNAKFEAIYQLGILVQRFLPHLNSSALHPNLAGGLMAMFFPGLIETMRIGFQLKPGRQKVLVFLSTSAALGVTALGLAISMSRGAWIALAVGLLAWGGLQIVNGVLSQNNRRRQSVALLLLTGGMGALLIIFLFGAQIMSLFPSLGSDSGYISRPDLQNSALLLLRDAPFTGSGLGTFPMTFSAYTLHISVPFISNAHQILVDIAISQGIPGLAAWLLFLAGVIWMAWQIYAHAVPQVKMPLGAACVMLVVMLIHGLVEDPYYDSRAVILWLVPGGLIAAQWRLVKWPSVKPAGDRLSLSMWGLTAVCAALLLGGVTLLPGWRAAWLADLGVVEQTRVELSRYDPDHFDNPTLDTIRRQADLGRAEEYFKQALAANPNQLTALQRLAMIALSRKEYSQALAWTRQAASLAPADAVARLLYGDALVANGQPEAGAAQVRGLIFAGGRFSGQAWYRYHLDGDAQRELWAQQANLLVQP